MDLKSLVSTKRRKLLLTSLAVLAVVCTATSVYAVFTIWSNIEHVTFTPQVLIHLTVAESEVPETLNLTANVTLHDFTPAADGIPVHFWVSIDAGVYTEIAGSPIATHDGTGIVSINYLVLNTTLTYDFEATVVSTANITP